MFTPVKEIPEGGLLLSQLRGCYAIINGKLAQRPVSEYLNDIFSTNILKELSASQH